MNPSPEALRAALPPLDGALPLPGLAAPVTVQRDAWGIPHIRAEGGASDAYRAQGFVHAQDRLFQMELNRRRALGRAAEWLGAAAAAGDILARRLGTESASRRDFAALGAEAQAMLEAYVTGINAFLDSGAPPAIEYTLLQAVPERWEPWHPIAVMRRLGLLMGSVWFKLWRAAALPLLGADGIAKLRYDDGGRDLLLVPPGAEAARLAADLDALRPAILALLEAGTVDQTGGGSNNWAVAPARSATGRPVVAGDPHRVFEIPNMYAQGHLACRDFDVVGLTVPGVPGFPHFAHNGQVAWCVTHAFVDIHDLYLERFDADASHSRGPDGWVPVTRRQESIAVRGGAPRTFEVLETRHGPVIAGDPVHGQALALRSVQFVVTDLSFDCLPRMLRAGSVAALFEATRGWGLIDHNLVAGDVAGQIGHQVRALVPVRPRANGWLPVPGWIAAHDWAGMIPHAAMPRVMDPPEGLIVTANNRIAAEEGPDYLCTDCHPPYRAQRILERLRAEPEARSVEGAAALHGDTLSANALLIRDRLARMAAPAAPGAAALRQQLLQWNGRMEAGSAAATAYVGFRRALTGILLARSGLAALAGDALLAVPPGVAPANQLWWMLPTLLRNEDCGLLGGLDWDAALRQALEEAASASRPWGEAHRPALAHPLSALFPDWAPLLDPPALPVGGDTDTVLATGFFAAAGDAAAYGALSRYAFDVGAWENSRWSVFHGASGHPGSPHYADQHAVWAGTAMVPMLHDWARIARAARWTQTLGAP
ncbi:penicillin acylase family protein [Falsiroseomonas selenitidurans]|uniref:Penicillin acylase family protein n=1 Tax=Falsiroseomonas selenitidurans TaxID=2716335 RepID=A0ABX1E261_9PROT|nr:penicillin acylase family protein [Falsiroseomonas selenitidurans]NKC31181.1 penicillin acylase family protein [Falsiroseomonas selenitidurans]